MASGYKLQLKERAQRMEETRRRIVEATVALHRTLGPAETTIKAIADEAGVQRHTVYRYFPDELSLHTACSRHVLANDPPPDPDTWQAIDHPEDRVRAGLTEVYAFYRRNGDLLTLVFRDMSRLPVVREVSQPIFDWQAAACDVLSVGWPDSGPAAVARRAALGLALNFSAWRILGIEQGLSDDQAVALMVGLVRCAVTSD